MKRRRGRPKKPDAGVTHLRRPEVSEQHPTYVIWCVRPGLPSLRGAGEMRVLRDAFRAGGDRVGFRLIDFSVKNDRVDMFLEADSARSLARGMQGLAVRVARRLNKQWQRWGKVFADRYEVRSLRTSDALRAASELFGADTREQLGPK